MKRSEIEKSKPNYSLSFLRKVEMTTQMSFRMKRSEIEKSKLLFSLDFSERSK